MPTDDTDDRSVGPGPESPPGTPRWVYVFGIIALVVILLFVILLVAGGGRHGPGRHMRGGGRDAPPSTVTPR